MTIPSAIAAKVAGLNAALGAAGDLNATSFETLNTLAWQAGTTAQAIEDAIDPAAGALDTFAAPLMPQDIVTAFVALMSAAETQTTLSELEGYIARIEINLENR